MSKLVFAKLRKVAVYNHFYWPGRKRYIFSTTTPIRPTNVINLTSLCSIHWQKVSTNSKISLTVWFFQMILRRSLLGLFCLWCNAHVVIKWEFVAIQHRGPWIPIAIHSVFTSCKNKNYEVKTIYGAQWEPY